MSTTDKSKLDGIATNANNYVHPTTAGNKHIPSGGSTGQTLTWSASGTAVWSNTLKNMRIGGTTSASPLILDANINDEALLDFYDLEGKSRGYIGYKDDHLVWASGSHKFICANETNGLIRFETISTTRRLPIYVDFFNYTSKSTITTRLFSEPPSDTSDNSAFAGKFNIQARHTILHGALLPYTNANNDIGTSALRFKTGYFSTLDSSGRATVGEVKMQSGNITINSVGSSILYFNILNDGRSLAFQDDTSSMYPTFRPSGNEISLGHSAHGWKYVYSIGGLVGISDKRLKKDIQYLNDIMTHSIDEKSYSEEVYDFFKNIKMAKYKLGTPIFEEQEDGTSVLSDVNFDNAEDCIGFIAQDLEESEVGKTILKQEEGSDIYNYKEKELLNNLIVAFQQAINKIDALEEKLENRVQELEALL